MSSDKADIVAQLKKDLSLLHTIRHVNNNDIAKCNLGDINGAFPNQKFPVAATHEFLTENPEDSASTKGFISYILSTLMFNGGISLWISSGISVFPPALKQFGIEADKIVFIQVRNEMHKLWVMEEALKCEGLSAVVGEIKDLGFMVSRRFQLAVEQSGVTGFIIRQTGSKAGINACVSRWKVSSSASNNKNDLPGISFPCWHIELLKIRNGRPASWKVEFSGGSLKTIVPSIISLPGANRKVV